MLGVEWTTEVGDNFTETSQISEKETPDDSSMFHGTIDLIGSSDDDYESDLVKPEDEESAKHRRSAVNSTNNLDVTDSSDIADDVVPQEDVVVDEDVTAVVGDIVDFVERNLSIPEFGYDPEALVKEEEIVLREGSCMKPHCQLGCLCSSLRGAFQHVPTHCSKEGCMFECHCQAKGLSAIDDETHYADKSKRKKKIPNRFKDVVLGRAYKKLHARTMHDDSDDSDSDSDYESSLIPAYKKTSPVSSPPKVPSPEPKKEGNGLAQNKPDNSWINSDKIANIKKTIAERRIGFVANTVAEDQTLADINIWCSQHNKYSCLCINYVYFSKTNYLLWKPSNKSRYLANKVMFDIQLKEPSHNEIPYEVFPYNRNNHCSRTYGALLDYNVRNKDETFISKRKLELEHNVLSYSNSYVKFRNFLLVKASEPVPSAEPYNRSGRKRSMGKMVHVAKTAERGKVDVGEENLDVKVNYQLDDGSEDEDQKLKVSGRKRKLTQKMKELEEERRREREAEIEDMKRIEEEIRLRQAMEEVPAKVPRKRGRPPKPKPELSQTPVVEKPSVSRRPSGGERSLGIRRPSCGEKSALDTVRRPSDGERPGLDMVRRPSDGERPALDTVRRPSDGERPAFDMVRRPSDGERSTIREPTPEVEIIPFKRNGLKFAVGEEKKEDVRIKQEPASPDYFSAESRMDMEVEPKDEDIYIPVAQAQSLEDKTSARAGSSSKSVQKTHPSKVSSKVLQDCIEKEFREDTPKPFLGFSDCDETSELEDCNSDFVDSIYSKKVLVLDPRTDGYPHLGLMCLTPGVGYISVMESLRGSVVIADPIDTAQQHSFNNLLMANDWLNQFFRSKVAFSTPNFVLQWILVTPGVLKVKQAKPVDPSIFQNPNIVITRYGPIQCQPNSANHTVASNCSLLRKQLSEHSVFRPLIKKQLAMRGADIVHHTAYDESRWVPNPKFGRKKMATKLPKEQSQSNDTLVSLQPVQMSFNTSEGCVTVQSLPVHCQNRSPERPPQLTPINAARPQFTATGHQQATLRPLPNLTKILSNKLAAKLSPTKKDY